MHVNFIVLLVAAFVPLLIGFIWYNKNIFGTSWIKAAGIDEEKSKGANMILIFGLTYLFSFFSAFAIQFMVVHQYAVYSVLANEPGIKDSNSGIAIYLKDFMEKYGHNFRTFKHGVLHGTMGGLTLALPIIGINALFERRGFKYIAINVGYWVISMAIMGGIICQFA